jgi:hypothetical protein
LLRGQASGAYTARIFDKTIKVMFEIIWKNGRRKATPTELKFRTCIISPVLMSLVSFGLGKFRKEFNCKEEAGSAGNAPTGGFSVSFYQANKGRELSWLLGWVLRYCKRFLEKGSTNPERAGCSDSIGLL